MLRTAGDFAVCDTLPSSMTDGKRERRSGKRLPVRVPVSVKASSGNVPATGMTRDLSTSGIFLYTDSRIVAGSELEMVLILPPEITKSEQQWVCCRASVVRVEDGETEGSFGVAASVRSMDIMPEIPS
jgi:PilZ domain